MAKPADKPDAEVLGDASALADAAGDPERQARLTAAIEKLSPAEAQKVLEILEREMTKRSRQLYGYIVSGIVLIIGMLGVLVYWGSVPEGTPIAWTIPIPFLFVAIVLIIFGRWSKRA